MNCNVVFDFSNVRLLSSCALLAIRAFRRRLSERSGRIVAAAGGDLVADVLKFASYVEHHHSVEDAIAAFDAPSSVETTARGHR